MNAVTKPAVWSIAGSDSSAGAGIQADLKTFEAFGVHGCTVVSALTAQNTMQVTRIEPVPASMVRAQLDALAADVAPAAIKVGMLGSTHNLMEVADCIDRLRRDRPRLPVVVDPVLSATTGAAFADDALRLAYVQTLLPRTTLLKPNRREAAALLGIPVPQTRAEVEHAAALLRVAGAGSVVITGGDESGGGAEDYADTPQASGWLTADRVTTPNHHGTGCVFSSSAATAMAMGFVEADAVVLAKMATTEALRHAYAAGSGAGPVRPDAGFGQNTRNLPFFSWPGSPVAPIVFKSPSCRDLGLYAVVDSASWVQRVLDFGVRTVQLRVKDPARAGLREEVRASIAAASRAGAQLFINDHWELAIEEGAYGIHLGQEDLCTADLPRIAAAGLRLGVSTHAYWEVCRAISLRPSYIACGPVHATAAKAMPWVPQGESNLGYWCRMVDVPVVAIGGMNPARASEARRRGAAGVAVMAGIMSDADPQRACAELLSAVGAPRGETVSTAALARSTLRTGW